MLRGNPSSRATNSFTRGCASSCRSDDTYRVDGVVPRRKAREVAKTLRSRSPRKTHPCALAAAGDRAESFGDRRVSSAAASMAFRRIEVSEIEVLRTSRAFRRGYYAIDLGMYPLGSCTMKAQPRVNEFVARLMGLPRSILISRRSFRKAASDSASARKVPDWKSPAWMPSRWPARSRGAWRNDRPVTDPRIS